MTTTALTYALARLATNSRLVALAIVTIFTWSRTTVEVFSMLWSEPLFLVLVLAITLLLVRAHRKGGLPWPFVFAISAALAGAVMLRYAGIFIALGTLLAVLVIPKNHGEKRLAQVLVMALVPLVALGSVAVANMSHNASPLGARYPSARSWQGSLMSVFDALGSSIFWRGTTSMVLLIAFIFTAFAVVGAWWGLIHLPGTLPLSLISVTYLIGLTYSQTSTRLDDASERLIYPVLPLILIIAALGLLTLLKTTREQVTTRWRGIPPEVTWFAQRGLVGAVVIVIVLVGLLNAARFSIAAHRGGIGYNAPQVEKSVATLVDANIPYKAGIASNEPWLVAWVRPTALSIPLPPTQREWPPERMATDRERLEQAVASGTVSFGVIFGDGALNVDADPVFTSSVAATKLQGLNADDETRIYRLQLQR